MTAHRGRLLAWWKTPILEWSSATETGTHPKERRTPQAQNGVLPRFSGGRLQHLEGTPNTPRRPITWMVPWKLESIGSLDHVGRLRDQRVWAHNSPGSRRAQKPQ